MHIVVLVLCSLLYSTQSLQPCTSSDFSNLVYLKGSGSAVYGSFSLTTQNLASVVSIQEDTVIMIIQMQGGSINNVNSIYYGDNSGAGKGSLTNTAGQYEYNIVSTTNYNPSTEIIQIQVKLPLENDYSAIGNSVFQVVIIPLCESVSIDSPISVDPWGKTGGGVLSILSYSDIIISADISASKAGFRGGPDYAQPIQDDSMVPAPNYATMVTNENFRDGYKGEGYIGTPQFGTIASTYPGQIDCSAGAPGNAGGGGNYIDGGAGGGGNGGLGGDGGRAFTLGAELILGGVGGSTSRADPTFKKIFLGMSNCVYFN